MEERISISLNLGNSCNMNCSYCYQDKREGTKKVSLSTLDKFAERVFEYDKLVNVNFFGGEPTLYKDEIKYLIEKLNGANVTYSMTSNGKDIKTITEINKLCNDDLRLLVGNKGLEYSLPVKTTAFRYVLTPYNLRDFDLAKLVTVGYEYIEICFDYTSNWTNVNKVKFTELIKELSFVASTCTDISIKLPYGNCENNNDVLCGYSLLMPMDLNGDVVICQRTLNSSKKDVVGNIHQETIEELIRLKNNFAGKETCGKYCYWNQLNGNQDNINVLIDLTKPLIEKYKQSNYIPEEAMVTAFRCQ